MVSIAFPDFQREHKKTHEQIGLKGNFSYGKDIVMSMIKSTGFPVNNVYLVEGFFEQHEQIN